MLTRRGLLTRGRGGERSGAKAASVGGFLVFVDQHEAAFD
jgi:hypothetical protein